MTKSENTPISDVLVLGGTHGEKRLVRGRFGSRPRGEGGPGVPLVKSLQRRPIITENGKVEAAIANPEAVRLGLRYKDADFQSCVGQPQRYMHTEEGQRVPHVLQRSKNRDLLVDMHEQPIDSGVDIIYISPRTFHYALGFALRAAISTIIVSEGCLHDQFPYGIVVDLSQNSKRDSVKYWRSLLTRTLEEGLPSPAIEEFTVYAHGQLTDSERDQLGTTNCHFSQLEEVKGAGELLKVNRPVYTLYSKGIEVVSLVEKHEINIDNGIMHLPTLRSLANYNSL